MNQFRTVVTCSVMLATLFILSIDLANAQPPPPAPATSKGPIAVRKLDGLKVLSPIYAVKGMQGNVSRPKEWFQISIEYDTEPEWLDQLDFTFYVLVKGKSKDAPAYSLFKAETSYINIPAGRKHIADMYIHPNIVGRYGDVERVAVEIRQGGRILERIGKPALTEAWWERLSPIEGMLLNRGQTPFSNVNIDDYEIIKGK